MSLWENPAAELQSILAAGENINIEFKSAAVRNETLAREMVAFANSYGGSILIGVEDDKSISGVSASDKWNEKIANIARNAIIPAINPTVQIVSYKGKDIAVVEIEKGKNKPYQTLGDGRFWIRVASTVRTATQQELARLFQIAGLVHYDISPVERSSIDDLNVKKLSDYYERNFSIDYAQEENKKRLLLNSNIVTELDGALCCTVGGLLSFSDFNARYLPQAGITIAVIKGETIADEVLQKKEINGTLPDMIDDAVAFLRLYAPEPLVVKNSARREDTLAIPVSVLREAVVNAVCHRDYSIANRKIHIYIFRDRVEIASPGRLSNTLTLENIRWGNSAPRNMFIVKMLDNMHYIDGLGRGIPLMIKEMGGRVSFAESGELFTVTLRYE